MDRVADKLIGDNLEYYLNMFYDFQYPGENHDTSAISAADRAVFLEAYSGRGALTAGLGWFRAFRQDIEDNRRWLAAPLQIPWLALADPRSLTAMTEQGRAISTRSRTVEIGPAGHWVLQQQPQQVLDALLPHLAERAETR